MGDGVRRLGSWLATGTVLHCQKQPYQHADSPALQQCGAIGIAFA
jgi:hypothetical protein